MILMLLPRNLCLDNGRCAEFLDKLDGVSTTSPGEASGPTFFNAL